MNGRQKVVLVVGLLLVFAAGVYPPWTQSWSFVLSGEDVQFRIPPGTESYSCLFHRPGVPTWVESSFAKPGDPNIKEDAIKDVSENGMRAVLRSVRNPGNWRSQVDISRLLVEWVVILAAVGIGYVLCAPSRTEGKA